MTKPKKSGPSTLKGSNQAKRLAAGIIEVLAGVRSPAEASEALSISVMRYYTLETRALQGLIAALEPLPRGRRRKPEDEVKAQQQKISQLERELDRMRALVRVAQRSIGLAPSASQKQQRKGKQPKGKKGKRVRRPRVRATVAVAALRTGLGGEEAPSSQDA